MGIRHFLIAGVMLASSSLAADVTEEETYSYKLDNGGHLSVSNINGSITVTGSSRDSVEIIATKKADNQDAMDEIEIEITHTSDRITIETEIGHSDSWFSFGDNSGEVTYEILVPKGTGLEGIESVNGDVIIAGVAGKVVAETVNGDVNCTDLASDAKFSTVNGDVEATFTRLEDGQRVKADSVNGRLTFTLPEDADVRVSADSLNGNINGRDFDLETDDGFIGSGMDGEIGGGSATLSANTVNGSIKVRSD